MRFFSEFYKQHFRNKAADVGLRKGKELRFATYCKLVQKKLVNQMLMTDYYKIVKPVAPLHTMHRVYSLQQLCAASLPFKIDQFSKHTIMRSIFNKCAECLEFYHKGIDATDKLCFKCAICKHCGNPFSDTIDTTIMFFDTKIPEYPDDKTSYIVKFEDMHFKQCNYCAVAAIKNYYQIESAEEVARILKISTLCLYCEKFKICHEYIVRCNTSEREIKTYTIRMCPDCIVGFISIFMNYKLTANTSCLYEGARTLEHVIYKNKHYLLENYKCVTCTNTRSQRLGLDINPDVEFYTTHNLLGNVKTSEIAIYNRFASEKNPSLYYSCCNCVELRSRNANLVI
nr:Caab137 [Calliteara abietis nucleopolyhedrovirus]